MANPIINRISEIHRFLMPKVIVTKLGTKSFYEKNEEVEFLEKKIEELKKQIILDLENGKFR
jgi:anti-sigma28 factor (negative regulator of flagellin synthesis)